MQISTTRIFGEGRKSGTHAHCRLCVAALALAVCVPIAGAQEEPTGGRREVPIYLSIEPTGLPTPAVKNPFEPVKTLPGHPVRILGVVALSLAEQQIAVTVTPPQGMSDPEGPKAESGCPDKEEDSELVTSGPARPERPTTVRARIERDGSFETTYTPRVTGEHEVVASAAEYRGEATFEVENLEMENCEDIPGEEIEKEAKDLSRQVCKIVDVIRQKIEKLPSSPAKEEFRRKLAEFEKELQKKPACGEAPGWVAGIGAINGMHRASPHTRRATRKIVGQFKTWLGAAQEANRRAPEVMSHLTSGNVLCDQLDIVINGLKFVDFYIGLMATPTEFFTGFLKEVVPTQLIGMAPPMKRTPALQQSVESFWKAIVNLPGKEGGERTAARLKIGLDLAAYATSRLFDAFCQQFTGPVSASMSAEIKNKKGEVWWTFKIELQGTLVLRYPKNATGPLIALTGEIYGNGTSFKSWDNAIPILFPELAQGTVFKTFRVEPFGMGDVPFLSNPFQDKKVGGLDVPDVNPLSVTLDKGGLITRSIFTPAFFRVPVRGDLREESIVVELQPATKDFDEAKTMVWQIMGPVLSLQPAIADYSLPYKGAHFIFMRAMSEAPVEFTIQRSKHAMTIEKKLNRERPNDIAKGVYVFSVKACNPGCDIPQPRDPEKPVL